MIIVALSMVVTLSAPQAGVAAARDRATLLTDASAALKAGRRAEAGQLYKGSSRTV